MNFFSQYKLVFLWTDIFVYLLIFSIFVGFFCSIKNEQFKKSLRKIYQNKFQIIAIVVLIFYLLIAALDSIHFRRSLVGDVDDTIDYSTKVESMLDVVLSPIGNQLEKTYSAPFAIYSYNPELVQTGSSYSWQQQRLQYAGSHLDSEKQKWRDILILSLKGLIIGIVISVITFLLGIGFVSLSKKQHYFNSCYYYFGILTTKNKNYNAVKNSLYSIFSIILLSSICYSLMQHYHIFGTDKVGKDVFYSAIKSIRTGVVIGILTSFIMLPFAIFFGTCAGYFKGIIDDIIHYIYTTISSVPGVLLIAASILMLQAYIDKNIDSYNLMLERTDLRLLSLCFILGITGWIGLCRLLRGETFKLTQENYIVAAQALGVSNFKIIIKHIVPNLSHIILISLALDFSGLVLAEAVLSYVGVGVDPSTYSWGNMINGARMEMAREPVVWWSLAGAFTFMFGLVFCANVFSDGLRDVLDPRIEVK